MPKIVYNILKVNFHGGYVKGGILFFNRPVHFVTVFLRYCVLTGFRKS